MYAEVGDRLVVGENPERTGLILAVPHADGTPPYVVKWLATGHIAMVSPGQFSRVVHAQQLTRNMSAARCDPPGPS